LAERSSAGGSLEARSTRRLRPEKSQSVARARGFESRHLHHRPLSEPRRDAKGLLVREVCDRAVPDADRLEEGSARRRGDAPMTEQVDGEAEAAILAAKARQAIAKRIAELVPTVEDEAMAEIVLRLAEAYADLAAEPPRARGG
jgi:hypothetical protein